MKTENSELLSLTFQPLHMERKLFMSFTAGFAFDLASGRPLEPGAAYAAAMGALAPGDCLDLGVPKKEAEWLLAGSAFVSEGAPAKGAVVSAQVGESGRRLLVESREPFASMPLSWKNTWGSDAENPDGPRAGKGEKAPVSDESMPHGAPACMGPRGTWPCRMGRAATYDSKWLRENWPGVPDDFDWGYYNLSQPQQRLPKGLNGGEKITLINLNDKLPKIETKLPKAAAVFKFEAGGRSFEKRPKPDTLWLFPGELVGLLLWHAVTECEDEAGAGIDKASLCLELDGETVTEEAAAAFAAPPEIPAAESAPRAARETVGAAEAAAAAAGIGVAGAAEASADKSGAEAKGAPQAENVEGNAAPRPQTSAPQAEIAEDSAPSAAEVRANAYKELDESLPEINAVLAEAGLPPLTPDQVAETKAHIDRLSGKMAEMQAQAAAAKPPTLEESLKRAGASDTQIASVKKALDIPVPSLADFSDQAAWNKAAEAYASEFGAAIGADDKTVASMKNILTSLPAGGTAEKSAPRSSADCAAQLVKAGMEPAAAARLVAVLDEDVPDDPKELLNYATRIEKVAGFPEGSVRGRIENIQKKTDELGVTNEIWPGGAARAKAAAQEPPAARADETIIKEAAEKIAKKPEDLPLTPENLPEILAAGGSVAGAKLDGFDLTGFNFSGLDMKGASFVKAKLDGARFDGTSLAGAAFAAASLSGASFVGADLSGADLASAAAADADFSETVMTGADISGASLAGATLLKVSAGGLKASGADLSEAHISFSDMSGADFSGAKLQKTDFHESCADGAKFAKAVLGGSTFCWGSSARKADFTGARLDGANWTNADAGGADFTGVSARGASFTDCELSSSRWNGADAAGGDFSRSRLEGASMRGANIFGGSMREARASGADLSKSNLFGADLCRMFTNEATDLRGADVGQTVIEARKGR